MPPKRIKPLYNYNETQIVESRRKKSLSAQHELKREISQVNFHRAIIDANWTPRIGQRKCTQWGAQFPIVNQQDPLPPLCYGIINLSPILCQSKWPISTYLRALPVEKRGLMNGLSITGDQLINTRHICPSAKLKNSLLSLKPVLSVSVSLTHTHT